MIANFRDTHFVLRKRTNSQSKRFGAQGTCTELCGTVDVWITVSLQNISPRAVMGENMRKEEKMQGSWQFFG